jgi:flagellar biosynthesis protein FlhG
VSDQAHSLRQLIHGSRPERPAYVKGPPMVVVTGGRAGVGTTTVAVNLGAVLAYRGERVLVVDATAARSNMADAVGINRSLVEHSLSDVLAGRCSAAEALVPGPAGTMLLTDHGGRRSGADSSRRDQHILFAELQALGSDFDRLVVDLGSELTAWTRRFWLQAQLVLLVTTADGSSLMDAYATIKRSVADGLGPDVRLVVNQCEDEGVAEEAHRRFSNACGRFLGHSVPSVPSLPRCSDEGGAHSAACVWERPNTPFGHAMLWLGRAVGDVLSTSPSELIAC